MFALMLLLSLAVQPFAVQNFFTVVGTVRDDGGRIVTGIRVSLEDENSQPIRTLFVDSSGRFKFPGLRAGNYRLRAETGGMPYEEYSQMVELQSMTNSDVNPSTTEIPQLYDITLKRKKGAPGMPAAVIFVQEIPPAAREEFNRGASSIKKEPAAGITALKKAIEMFPDYFEALDLLGTEYVKTGQYEEGTTFLLRAVAVNNKSYASMYALGVGFLKLNRFDESIEWLQKASAGDPGNANVFMMLGVAYGSRGALTESETALKKAYQLGGAQFGESHWYLAGIYNKQQRYGEAWRQLELYLKESKDIKDKAKINDLIASLKAKEKAKQ